MTAPTAQPQRVSAAPSIAKAFVEARRAARPLLQFPGPIPTAMAEGYKVQELSIELWAGEVVGWKVGKIPEPLVSRLGQTRVTGPIFRENVWQADPAGRNRTPVFVGGFAAIEAEFIFELLEDAPPGKLDWSLAEANELRGRMRLGAEMAGSPLATINELGPPVVAVDFGNNNGLILGDVFADWGEADENTYVCETYVENERVGVGSPASIPGGPMESVRFLLEHTARRGRPLKSGQFVSTGAATGIHDILAGQIGRVSFGRHGEVGCFCVPAEPRP